MAILNANALVSLESLKEYLKIPVATTSSDDLLKTFINEISALIENYCNRKFIAQTYTEIKDGGGTRELFFFQWPVTSITSLHIDPSRVFDSSTLIDSSDYAMETNEAGENYSLVYYKGTFPLGKHIIKLIYTAGYADIASVPADLQLATKRTIAFYWKQQQNQDFTETNKSKGDENITLIQGIPENAIQILEYYKRLDMPSYLPTYNY